MDVHMWMTLDPIRRLKSLSSDAPFNFEPPALRQPSNGDPAFFQGSVEANDKKTCQGVCR